jgi:hypothetical protein
MKSLFESSRNRGRKGKRRAVVLVAVLSCAGLVACGGSGDGHIGGYGDDGMLGAPDSSLLQSKILGCRALEADERYRCPYVAVSAQDEFIFTKVLSDGTRAVFAGRVDQGKRRETPVVAAPPGWVINQTSISPDREHLLLTMQRPSCAAQWPDPAGRSCSWGRGTLWLVSHRDGAWLFENLSTRLGKNSNVVGWSTWLTSTRALFNAKAAPLEEPIITGPDKVDVPAYLLELKPEPSLRVWGEAAGISSRQCFVGRMHASGPARTDECFEGQRVAITRRCFDEPVSPERYAWFNQRSDQGDAGMCASTAGPAWLVPVFQVYVVELSASCEPKTFDRSQPIRAPDWQGHWRHMGVGQEWGDGQSTISADGTHVAFWSNRGYDFGSPTDNCEAFASRDGSLGNGASRVRYCELDAQRRCKQTLTLPAPVDPWLAQGNAYFHRLSAPGNVRLITSEGGVGLLTFTRTGERVMAFDSGGGGYPISPP